jgi:CheY-like chemotaxis protein
VAHVVDTVYTVLCIDDDAVGLRVRSMLLERAGYHVLSALNGLEGLALFSQNRVDAVVLDFSMPGMTGGEVVLHLRRIRPKIPILMLSAYTSLPPDLAEMVDQTMTKGEGAPALLGKLGSLLRERASDAE